MARKRNGTSNGVSPPPVVDNPQGDTHVNNNGVEKPQPVHRIRMRNVSCAIWRNEGAHGPWYTTTMSRSYRDEKGDWHTSQNFSAIDLLILAEVARAAFAWVVMTSQAYTAPIAAMERAADPVADNDIPF